MRQQIHSKRPLRRVTAAASLLAAALATGAWVGSRDSARVLRYARADHRYSLIAGHGRLAVARTTSAAPAGRQRWEYFAVPARGRLVNLTVEPQNWRQRMGFAVN